MLSLVFKTGTLFFVMLLVALGITFLFLSERAATSHGSKQETVRFSFPLGESLTDLGQRLEEEGLISDKWTFILYVIKSGEHRSLQAGEYALSGKLLLPDLVNLLASGKVVPPGVKITFPEGWTIGEMAARLMANDLPGEDFRKIVSDPFPKWRERYPFLRDLPAAQNFEGYLFPDTYIFPKEATAELIVDELLETFGKKVTNEMIAQAKAKGLSLHELVTLASIVEAEVNTKEDRQMVADVFLRRMEIGQALQSDATLRYILGETKIKYSLEETKTVSPYNTYQNAGLPPGPIGNPSLEAIEAVLNPTPNEYYYFLNNATNGATVFSRTFEEHVANKAKNGL